MSYTKLSSSILTSTIWTEDANTKLVWITLLVLADKNGEVTATIPGLARMAGVPIPDCEHAVNKFLAPDPYSRTPDDQGRRLEQIEGGWCLLNHQKYRLMAGKDEQKSTNADRQRRWRERQERNAKSVTSNASVTPSNAKSVTNNATVTQGRDIAEAEADTITLSHTLSGSETVDPPVTDQEREGRALEPEPPPTMGETSKVDFSPNGKPALIERIMAAYPTRAGQPNTAREFLTRQSPELLAAILPAVERYALAVRSHPQGMRFVQSIHKFFTNEQYLVPADQLLRPHSVKTKPRPRFIS